MTELPYGEVARQLGFGHMRSGRTARNAVAFDDSTTLKMFSGRRDLRFRPDGQDPYRCELDGLAFWRDCLVETPAVLDRGRCHGISWILMSRLDGSPPKGSFAALMGGTGAEARHRKLAMTAAELHRHIPSSRNVVLAGRGLPPVSARIEAFENASSLLAADALVRLPELEELIAAIESAYETGDVTNLHGDYGFANVLMPGTSDCYSVVDFENSRIGFPEEDFVNVGFNGFGSVAFSSFLRQYAAAAGFAPRIALLRALMLERAFKVLMSDRERPGSVSRGYVQAAERVVHGLRRVRLSLADIG